MPLQDVPNGFPGKKPNTHHAVLLDDFREEREPSAIRVVEMHDEMLAFIPRGRDITR